jgi:hypothetical protein
MLYTYIHHKEYADASWDVAHVYEHLITRSFQSYLESLNINPGLIGHVSGDTFEHIIFLNATFYDQQVADAYEHFLTKPELIDTSYISQMLLECEAEEKISLVFQDKVKFDEQLQALITELWTNNDSISQTFTNETASVEDIFEIKRAAKESRDVSVGVYVDVDSMDGEERALFLRLSALVGDMIGFALRKELDGSYYVASSPISKDDAIMGNTHHLRFKRNTSLKSIKEVCEAAINDINIELAMPFIMSQFEEFADQATWKTFAIDYYRHTGIVTNTEYIASLATRDRISAILPKVKIHVRDIQKDDEKQF